MTRTHDQFLPEGMQIGVYEIKNVLKFDSFSITYCALNHHMKGQVVLKEYFPQDLAKRESGQQEIKPSSPDKKNDFEYGLKEFLQQADILLQVEHPNIVSIENVLQLNGTAYLILDHQAGVSLAKFDNASELFDETKARFILTSTLEALEKIHDNHTIHGDIHPDTILMDKKGEPKLTEFSAARLTMAKRANTLDSALATHYASIEQFDLNSEPRAAADFYALGTTLLYCMSHAEPVTAKERIVALRKGSDPIAAQLDALSASYSADFLDIIKWMTALERSKRPQTASEILSRLRSDSDVKADPDESEIIDRSNGSHSMLKSLVLTGTVLGLLGLITYPLWDQFVPQKLSDQIAKTTEAITTPPAPEPIPDSVDITVPATEPQEQPAVSIAQPEITQPEVVEEIKAELQPEKNESLEVTTPALDRSVEQYLEDAETAMREFRLTTPADNNAFSYYQAVLDAQPSHQEATAGLNKIVDQYIQLIEKALKEGNKRYAQVYLKRAEKVIPNSSRLKKYREISF